MKLEGVKPGLPLVGLEPSSVATVAAIVPIGHGAVQVFYRTPDGTTKDARAYNEVVTSWSGIESAAAKEPAMKQGELF